MSDKSTSDKSTLLIVDDEPLARYALEALLEPEGYHLLFASNGLEALEKAAAHRLDLVLLDVMLPDMDGFEVCKRLRVTPRLAELPIVMVTALDDPNARLRGIEEGADDFLNKPFNSTELRARVRTITRLNRYRRLLEQQERLAYLTNYDVLTGLPNRNLLLDRLRYALSQAGHMERGLAVLAIALDGIKRVTQTLGHDIGDRMFKVATERLLQCIRTEDTLARVGDGELIVLTVSVAPARVAAALARRIVEELKRAVTLNNHDLFITPSVGISLHPRDGEEAKTLIKNAETARSRAIAEDKGRYRFFAAEMNAAAMEQLTLEAQLRKALDGEGLILYYQPKVDLSRNEIVGAEALLRWQHPERGMVAPGKFIPLAEDTGLILPLGEWVMRAACRQNRAWRAAGLPALRVSVNVSGHQFRAQNLVDMVAQILQETGLDPSGLELEITESCLIAGDSKQDEALQILYALKALGVTLSIDDFGTGYSSLSQLRRLPVDILKIDRTFVSEMLESKDATAITRTIVAMGRSMGLEVIAEGVERQEHLDYLREIGCHQAQGYLFSPPVPAESFADLL